MKPQDRTRTILRCGLDTEAKMIAIAIADYLSDDAGRAWPSMPTLSRDTGLTTRTLRRRVAVAVADGWLDTDRRVGGSTRYGVVWASPAFAPCDVTPDRESPRTGSPPGQGVQGTPDTESAPPGQGVQGTPDRLSTEVDQCEGTTDPTIRRDHTEPAAVAASPAPTEPEPMPTPDDLEATADGYRNGRTTPNLSTDTEPDPPHLAPDGRPVPPTWSALLGPVVQRLPPGEASAVANVIRALRHVPELAPRYLLTVAAEDWKYQKGIGGEARANLLATLSARAGWPPGCLTVAPVRRMTLSEAFDLITGEESQRWEDGGSLRDPITGACIVPPLVAPVLTMLPGGAR